MSRLKPAEDRESIKDIRRDTDSLDREVVAAISHRVRSVDAAAAFEESAADGPRKKA